MARPAGPDRGRRGQAGERLAGDERPATVEVRAQHGVELGVVGGDRLLGVDHPGAGQRAGIGVDPRVGRGRRRPAGGAALTGGSPGSWTTCVTLRSRSAGSGRGAQDGRRRREVRRAAALDRPPPELVVALLDGHVVAAGVVQVLPHGDVRGDRRRAERALEPDEAIEPPGLQEAQAPASAAGRRGRRRSPASGPSRPEEVDDRRAPRPARRTSRRATRERRRAATRTTPAPIRISQATSDDMWITRRVVSSGGVARGPSRSQAAFTERTRPVGRELPACGEDEDRQDEQRAGQCRGRRGAEAGGRSRGRPAPTPPAAPGTARRRSPAGRGCPCARSARGRSGRAAAATPTTIASMTTPSTATPTRSSERPGDERDPGEQQRQRPDVDGASLREGADGDLGAAAPVVGQREAQQVLARHVQLPVVGPQVDVVRLRQQLEERQQRDRRQRRAAGQRRREPGRRRPGRDRLARRGAARPAGRRRTGPSRP